MIISCPSCSARYVVNIDDVGRGRQVKCTRCNHSWYFENKVYEAEKKLLINEISNEKIIRESLSDQNLPVVYKKQKNIPLPFLILILPSRRTNNIYERQGFRRTERSRVCSHRGCPKIRRLIKILLISCGYMLGFGAIYT